MARTLFHLYRCSNCHAETMLPDGAPPICPQCGSMRMVIEGLSLDKQAIEGRGETHTPTHFANPRTD